METASNAFAPRRDLLSVPSRSISVRSMKVCSTAARPTTPSDISGFPYSTGLRTPLPPLRALRQHRDELALAPGGGALPARQLHRMRGVEYHRAAGVAHDRERAHVGHQVSITE